MHYFHFMPTDKSSHAFYGGFSVSNLLHRMMELSAEMQTQMSQHMTITLTGAMHRDNLQTIGEMCKLLAMSTSREERRIAKQALQLCAFYENHSHFHSAHRAAASSSESSSLVIDWNSMHAPECDDDELQQDSFLMFNDCAQLCRINCSFKRLTTSASLRRGRFVLFPVSASLKADPGALCDVLRSYTPVLHEIASGYDTSPLNGELYGVMSKKALDALELFEAVMYGHMESSNNCSARQTSIPKEIQP